MYAHVCFWIIPPKYTSKPPPPLKASLHIKDYQFRYSGQQNTTTTSSIPTKTFNMSCKPTNTATCTFNAFPGPPTWHLELQKSLQPHTPLLN